ncbi:MAG TPA: tRNA glutamyl-Q(34) synthetase GluQRS [Patescibacteria group bacterium]|nr:tRNA glutamyl-Q(34) synthetase GluQRS [Patescibacteria group bacterium]
MELMKFPAENGRATVRGRFAPSPTGEMHLGNAWSALVSWLLVRQAGGVMVLRVEDLDPDRSRASYAKQLMRDMTWLGLDWDEGPDVGGPYGPYCQDRRRQLYQDVLAVLTQRGLAYPCYCSRDRLRSVASAPHGNDGEWVYPGFCRELLPEAVDEWRHTQRSPAWRLKVPPGIWRFQDGVYGPVAQDVSREVGDFIICRSDGVAAYQLAVVVDDAAMGITHVVRGSDLLVSTPRQLLLYQLLGQAAPTFAHVPLLCAGDGRRLSKRDGDLTLAALRRQGIAAETVVGYLAWKGGLLPEWQPITARELIEKFSLGRLSERAVLVTEDARDRRWHASAMAGSIFGEE